MKLLRNEATLGFITLLFILAIIVISLSSPPDTVLIANPETQLTPHLININSADAVELDFLEGIGPALAEKIIEYRNQNGPFKSPYDICLVPGIGDSTYTAIRDCIEV